MNISSSIFDYVEARLRFRPLAALLAPRASRRSSRSARSAFTLIEMMVVILLIVLMTSILIPVLSNASDVRRAREGARVLSTLINAAQVQATVSGRGSAVWIQRLKNSSGAAINSAAAMDLFLADVPPPYLGDVLNSTASVMSNTVTFSNANLTAANVQSGDLIRFSYRGEFYVLNNSGGLWSISPLDSTQSWPVAGNLPFQIYRRPIKSLASAVQLTDGVAIDLGFSGADFNSNGTNFNFPFSAASGDIGQILITFSPTGALDLVYIVSSTTGQATVFRPLSGVYLLIGKIEKIPPQAQSAQNQYPANWQDFDCRWVGIGRQSGLVTTAEVASAPTGTTANVITSLRLARSSQNTGGN
jgi:prepilin-type N-terminal cleavage/methylation domain-containing protein